MKCLLLQQWFSIDSDPELETQINDRASFKTFLGISFDDNAPDHSTFSRFRGRFSKDTMSMINNELLNQFAAKGLTINEGIAIDVRLVKSASHPISRWPSIFSEEPRSLKLHRKRGILPYCQRAA